MVEGQRVFADKIPLRTDKELGREGRSEYYNSVQGILTVLTIIFLLKL